MALQAAPADNWPNLIAPDGSLTGVHPDDVQSALAQGYQYATPEQVQNHYQQQQYGSLGQQAKTIAEGAARGVAGPLATAAETNLLGVDPADIKGREEANPVEAGGSEIAGLVGSSLTGVGEGALLSKAGEAAKGLVAASDALKAQPLAARLGAAAVQGAAENVLYGVGNSVNENLLGDKEALGEALIPSIGFNALVGGVGGVGLSAVGAGTSKLAKYAEDQGWGVGSAVKRIIGQATGVDTDTISEYAKNREAINSIPERDEIIQHGYDNLKAIQDNLGSAKDAYANLESSMKEDLRQKGYDAGMASRAAKTALSEAQERLEGESLSKALDAAPNVSNAVSGLRNHVMEGSNRAYDILDQSGQQVDLSPMYGKAKELTDNLEQQGTIESKNQAEAIKRQMASIQELHPTSMVPAASVKPLIKGLDNISGWSMGNSTEQNVLGKQFRQLRHTLDSTLKDQVPAYAEAMKPVATDASLLEGVDKYSDPATANRAIKNLSNPVNYRNEMPFLSALEKRVGTPLTGDIERYSNPQMRKALEEALPQATEARNAAAAVDELRDPAYKKAWQQKLLDSPEYKALQDAQHASATVNNTRPEAFESKLDSAMRNKGNDAAKRLMSQIPGMEGKSLPEILDALRVKQAFEKGAMNGSRNVNAYGALGGLMGSIGHSVLGPAGGIFAGGAAGHIIDKHGPAIAKKILDTYLDNEAKLSGLSAIHGAATSLSDKISTGAKKVFSASGPAAASVAAKWDYEKVKGMLNDFNSNPNGAINDTAARTKDLQRVAPDTTNQLTTKLSGAASFLQSKLPATPPKTPFQPNFKDSNAAISKFKKFHDVVQNPVSVLAAVKDGTVTPDQIQTLSTVYPKTYQIMRDQLTNEMMDHVNKGKPVPYQTRIGVSMFLGSPLDSTMAPASIMAAQPQPKPQPSPAPQPGKKSGKVTAKGGEALGKMAASYKTPSQASAADQADRD